MRVELADSIYYQVFGVGGCEFFRKGEKEKPITPVSPLLGKPKLVERLVKK
jgi:hypothetical protein